MPNYRNEIAVDKTKRDQITTDEKKVTNETKTS